MILTIKQKEVTLAKLNKRFDNAIEKYCVSPKGFTFEKDEF